MSIDTDIVFKVFKTEDVFIYVIFTFFPSILVSFFFFSFFSLFA